MDKPIFRRKNYCKYNQVRGALLKALQVGRSAKQISEDLDISLQTFYKYKGLASIESGLLFTVPEEQAFLDKQEAKAKKKSPRGATALNSKSQIKD